MFESLLKTYIDYFAEIGESAIITICNCKVPSMVILSEYKKLPKIENMGDKEKIELKKYVTGLFPDKTIQEKLNCCKIIYTIGTLL